MKSLVLHPACDNEFVVEISKVTRSEGLDAAAFINGSARSAVDRLMSDVRAFQLNVSRVKAPLPKWLGDVQRIPDLRTQTT